MSNRYYIGLDNGGSVTKAGLFDHKGTEIAIASVPAQLITPREHYVERDAEELFRSNVHCIAEVLKKSGVSPADVKALSITGFGNGIFLVGSDGKPTYNGIISTDTRADSCVQRWIQKGVEEKILPKTRQILWAGQLISLIRWFAENSPGILQKSAHAFSVTDYVRFRLTGEAYGEITNISGINAMNLETKEYDDEVLRLLEVYEYKRLLPPIRLSCEVCGGITAEIAAQTGLVVGTPVAGGLFDISACPIATGVVDGDLLSIVAGTWAINSFITKKLDAHRNPFMTSIYPVDGNYLLTEASMTSASNLEWFVQKLMKKEAEEAAKSGRSVYDVCNELVAGLPPEENPVIFLPFVYGTNVNANAKSCFIGMNYLHERQHLIRAVYEGVAFSAMMHIEKLMKFRPDKPRAARISGGVAKSEVWVQMFADVLQMTIEVSDAKELGAMGAAICAAVSVGEFKSYEEAIAEFVKIKAVHHPDPAKKDIYEKKYRLYKKLVENLDPFWAEWNVLA